jgi:hypothetical protein
MNIYTKTAKAIVLGAVVAALAAPVSQAGTKLPPDPGLGGRIGYNILYRDQLRAASEAPATSASGIVDDYFRAQRSGVASTSGIVDDYFRNQATPVQRIIAQEQARGIAADDYFRDGQPTLSADERYLNTVASRQALTVHPSVSVDDWFRDGRPTLSADERYLNTVASRQASTVQPSVSVDDWFRDRQVEAAPTAVAQSTSGGFHVGDALIGAGASLGLMLLAAMGIRQRREHQHLKSA